MIIQITKNQNYGLKKKIALENGINPQTKAKPSSHETNTNDQFSPPNIIFNFLAYTLGINLE